jgi:hypothetical protein
MNAPVHTDVSRARLLPNELYGLLIAKGINDALVATRYAD